MSLPVSLLNLSLYAITDRIDSQWKVDCRGNYLTARSGRTSSLAFGDFLQFGISLEKYLYQVIKLGHMGEILTFSQFSLLQGYRHQLGTVRQVELHVYHKRALSVGAEALSLVPTRFKKVRAIGSLHCEDKASFFGDSKMPTTFPVVSAGTGSDILPDSGGSNDNFSGGNGDGGGGIGKGGNNNKDKGGPGENDGHNSGDAKKVGMSMSQKLTLGYAALVGAGGAMGYVKGGSKKSLISGGLSALVLYTVYCILPTNPVLASCLGLGLSFSLLVMMGSRFKRSGKIFPAGVVSLVSLVMSAGYLHGILRSMH